MSSYITPYFHLQLPSLSGISEFTKGSWGFLTGMNLWFLLSAEKINGQSFVVPAEEWFLGSFSEALKKLRA